MATIFENLSAIISAKNDISCAILEKGGSVPQYLSGYGDAIRDLPSGGGGSYFYNVPLSDVFDPMTGGLFQHNPVDLVFNGLTGFPANYRNSWQYRFGTYADINSKLRSVSFPDIRSLAGDSTNRSPLFHTFDYNSSLTSVSFPNLYRIGTYVTPLNSYVFNYAFANCAGLNEVTFPTLSSLRTGYGFQYAFYGSTNLRKLSFPALKTLAGNYVFDNLIGLTSTTSLSLDFPVLEKIETGTKTFTAINGSSGTSLKAFSFPSLSSIANGQSTQASAPFGNNPGVTDIYLPSWKQFSGGQYLFYNNTALARIHCGAANETAVKAFTGYSNKWGAPSTCQILFDL